MKKNLPPNIEWFFPYLEKFDFFKKTSFKDIFKYSTEELIKKYKKLSQLISLLLTERIIEENLEEKNLISYKLLELVLEKREVPGYVFCFKNEVFKKYHHLISEFSFIKLDENYYFYPLEWGNVFKLLVNLWKKGVSFFSSEINLSKESSIESAKNYIKLAQVLNFSYFSQKTLEDLKNYLPTLEIDKLLDITNKFFKSHESFLILSSKNEIKKDLGKGGVKIVRALEKEKVLLLVKGLSLEQLVSLLENRCKDNKIGILSKEIWRKYRTKELSPLMFLIGAFEHARRANNTNMKVFEGFTYHILGDLYYEWKDFGKALRCYLLAQDYTEQPVELALSESAIYYTFGDLEKAEKILKNQVCSCKKEDPLIHYNLGLIYLNKKESEKAKYHFYKAYLLDPENSIFRETLAKFLWDHSEYEELEFLLNSAKKLSLKEKIYVGKLYFFKKEYKKAFECLKEILSFKERDGETLLFLAWLYLYFNKEKEVSEILLREAKDILSLEEIERIKREFNLELE